MESVSREVTPTLCLSILFYSLFGLVAPNELPTMTSNPQWSRLMVQIVYGTYHVVTVIVLLNLLIAMMSDTYQRIQVGVAVVVFTFTTVSTTTEN